WPPPAIAWNSCAPRRRSRPSCRARITLQPCRTCSSATAAWDRWTWHRPVRKRHVVCSESDPKYVYRGLMYQRGEEVRTARGRGEPPQAPRAEAAAGLARARVAKLLEAYPPGLPCARPRLQAALASPLADAATETERLFALGWLAWLDGSPVAAEPLLAE